VRFSARDAVDVLLLAPLSHRVSQEVWAIVAAALSCSILDRSQLPEDGNDADTRSRYIAVDGERFVTALVSIVEQAIGQPESSESPTMPIAHLPFSRVGAESGSTSRVGRRPPDGDGVCAIERGPRAQGDRTGTPHRQLVLLCVKTVTTARLSDRATAFGSTHP